jgi:sulfite exporter TauE/SafE
MSQALRRGGMGGVMLLGALNGLLPCGLVYGALLVAASLGGPLQGMVGMLFFGLATIPALFLVAMGSGMLNVDLRQSMSRVAGFLIVLVGVQLILRGFSGLQVIAHFHVGKLMIW